ncbi:MAG: hypothetical protein ACHREM_04100 [Polyangiales bacterium]
MGAPTLTPQLDYDAATNRLTAAGLCARWRADGFGLRIVGGTSVDNVRGIEVYQRGFRISPNRNGTTHVIWMSPEDQIVERDAASVDEAVTVLLGAYPDP